MHREEDGNAVKKQKKKATKVAGIVVHGGMEIDAIALGNERKGDRGKKIKWNRLEKRGRTRRRSRRRRRRRKKEEEGKGGAEERRPPTFAAA